MNATSRALVNAALGRCPRHAHHVGAWTGNGEGFQVVASRLASFKEWWDRTAPIEARRMFLVLCAYDHELVLNANRAAYHGDCDGDLDGYDGP